MLGALVSSAADDVFYYEARGESLVITNTPSSTAQRVTWLEGPTAALPAGDTLPASVYDAAIARAARAAGLSASLVKAVVWAESGFNARAVSPAGALGLMQLMPRTAAQYGVTDPFDPEQNLRAGATHLRRLLNQFDGDLTLALAAYNAGAGTVRRHGGVPDYPETQKYVSKIRSRVATRTVLRAPPPRRTLVTVTVSSLRLSRSSDGSFHIEN